MNYQHAFHAGNFADVHKHIVLTRILVHLRRKAAAFRVIDSHAGAGRYDLRSSEAIRGGEWQGGIARLWRALPSWSDAAVALLEPYRAAVAALNPGGALSRYPGSPVIARSLLRAQDRLTACEIEPRAAAALKAALRGDDRVKVLALDGWTALGAMLPPRERRGLALIDPPFEDAADFLHLSTALAAAHRKWPTGIYLLWYPIKDRAAPDALARRLRRAAVPKVLRSEISLGAPRADAGLTGSGLIVVNPPFPLAAELRALMPALASVLSPASGHRLEWLAGEAPAGS